MSSEKEDLLLPGEIKHIEEQAKVSLLRKFPQLSSKFTTSGIDVRSLSPVHKVIFVDGGRDTGLNHIRARHGFYTNEFSQYKGRFYKTNTFDEDKSGLHFLRIIADPLYESKRPDLNKKVELFDFYQAEIHHPEPRLYSMVLYKDTKIVHTIFPTDQKESKRFRKENIKRKQIDQNRFSGIIHYTDINNKVRYGIGVKVLLDEAIEKWEILFYKNDKIEMKILFPDTEISYPKTKDAVLLRLESLNYQNLTPLEDVILEFEDDKNNFDSISKKF